MIQGKSLRTMEDVKAMICLTDEGEHWWKGNYSEMQGLSPSHRAKKMGRTRNTTS